jgi:hypothetical protein
MRRTEYRAERTLYTRPDVKGQRGGLAYKKSNVAIYMQRRKSGLHVGLWAWCLSLCLSAVSAGQYDGLQYQRRGEKDEGLRTVAVSGPDVELVSARIEGSASRFLEADKPSGGWGEVLVARFYVPQTERVYLSVRQLRSLSTYYWLTFPTRFAPDLAAGWTAGAVNEYAWQTSPVLSALPGVTRDNLGVVARQGERRESNVQRVLPVALFDNVPIESAQVYRFSWRALTRVKVEIAVSRLTDEPAVTIDHRASRWEEAGSPFIYVWRPAGAQEGWYRVTLTGHFSTNAPLTREVQFYHKVSLTPSVRRTRFELP